MSLVGASEDKLVVITSDNGFALTLNQAQLIRLYTQGAVFPEVRELTTLALAHSFALAHFKEADLFDVIYQVGEAEAGSFSDGRPLRKVHHLKGPSSKINLRDVKYICFRNSGPECNVCGQPLFFEYQKRHSEDGDCWAHITGAKINYSPKPTFVWAAIDRKKIVFCNDKLKRLQMSLDQIFTPLLLEKLFPKTSSQFLKTQVELERVAAAECGGEKECQEEVGKLENSGKALGPAQAPAQALRPAEAIAAILKVTPMELMGEAGEGGKKRRPSSLDVGGSQPADCAPELPASQALHDPGDACDPPAKRRKIHLKKDLKIDFGAETDPKA